MRIDINGQRFARLVVTGFAYTRARLAHWHCTCDCGAAIVASGDNLRRGHTRSCGCLLADTNKELRQTHGMRNAPEYEAWQGMIGRCEETKGRFFARYGGRGIRVCPEWRHDFEAFLLHVGPRPSSKHSIDRINNDGNYEPGNVRWATAREQVRNSTAVKYVLVRGERMIQKDAALALGVSPALITRMVQRGKLQRA